MTEGVRGAKQKSTYARAPKILATPLIDVSQRDLDAVSIWNRSLGNSDELHISYAPTFS